MIRLSNLKNEVKASTNSLRNMDQSLETHRAQILHLTEGQLKLAQELNNTQLALNRTMELVNEYSTILRNHETALKTITSMTIFLSNRLTAFVHSVETHFIHKSIEDILSNKLNLRFIHHKDLPKIIELVTQATNISFDKSNNSIPMVELITRLLVQQRIDFIPTKTLEPMPNGLLIGKLMFTSFFATPSKDQDPFSIYELVPIPFNRGKNRVRLAQMPAYLGLEPKSRQFIRSSKEEAASCNFILMSSCRETPPIRKDWEDQCLYQILTNSKLIACRTELYPGPVFVHRIGRYWAVSTNVSTKYHSVTISDSDQHQIIDNDVINLPPVVLITTMDTNSLTCDRFFLPGLPVKIGPTVNVIQNVTTNPVSQDLIDLQSMLSNDTHWAKLPYIPSNIQAIIDFISSTPNPIPMENTKQWTENSVSIITIVIATAVVALLVVLIYYIHAKKSKSTNVTITIPSMKSLQD